MKYDVVCVLWIKVLILFVHNAEGQVTCPALDLSYITDPSNPCNFYLCYRGIVSQQPFTCPTDPVYIQLVFDSNLMLFTACQGCFTTVTTTTAVPPVTIQTTQSGITSTGNTLTTTKGLVDVINDAHIPGGRFIGSSMSILQCRDLCITDSTCLAFDHDSRNNTCWFHDILTACNPTQSKGFCIHLKLTDCSSTTTSTTTNAAVTTTTATTTTPTTTATTTTTIPTTLTTTPVVVTTTTMTTIGVPGGFVSFTSGMHIVGGFRMLVAATEQQCLDFCLMESFCLAVDYNMPTSSCYLHFTATYCNQLTPEVGTTHFKRLPCVQGSSNSAFEMRNKFHVLGGTSRGSNINLETCLSLCYLDNTCAGVDFDSQGGVCYVFTTNNVCDPLLPKDFCIHVSLQLCSVIPGTITTAQTTPAVITTTIAMTTAFVPPTGDFIQLLFPGPSTLPSGWQAYPGMQINNGTPIGGLGLTGDQCINLCFTDPTCQAVDFNSGDGTCYKHDIAQKCNVLGAINEVYHAKRDPVCTLVNGLNTPYPTPVGIAP